jgi:hypothetical protein
MKKLHPKIVVAGILVAGLVIVAAGLRVRTQTGWRMKIVGEGISETKTRDGVHLSLRLVDTRDQKRREYDGWFRVDEMRKASANIEVDCGEYKRLLLWKTIPGSHSMGSVSSGRSLLRKKAPARLAFISTTLSGRQKDLTKCSRRRGRATAD